MARDLRAELLASASKAATTWKPEPGDLLVGKLLRYSEGESQYGKSRIVEVLEESTGAVFAVWLAPRVLRDLFDRQQPKVGDRVGIRRLEDGRPASGGAKPYKMYTLVVEPANPTPVQPETSAALPV